MKFFRFNLAKQKIKCQQKRIISNQIFTNFLQQNLIPCFHYIGSLFAPFHNGSWSNGNRNICDPIRIVFCFHLKWYNMTYSIHFIHYKALKSLLIKKISQISYSNIDPVRCVSLSEAERCRTYPIQKSCRKMSGLMETEGLFDTKSVTDQ